MDRYQALEEVLDDGDSYNDNPEVEGWLGGVWWTEDGVTYLRIIYHPDNNMDPNQHWTWRLEEVD